MGIWKKFPSQYQDICEWIIFMNDKTNPAYSLEYLEFGMI